MGNSLTKQCYTCAGSNAATDHPMDVIERSSISIETSLKDLVVDTYKSVSFICSLTETPKHPITCIWTKDGEICRKSNRIQMTTNGKDFKLNIRYATLQDQGIYLLLFIGRNIRLISKGTLHVKPERPKLRNGVLYYQSMPRHRNGTEWPLINRKISVGKPMKLSVVFKEDNIKKITWYKSNEIIEENERTILFNEGKKATLCITHTLVTDTGIYCVVAKTANSIESSFAEIIVLNIRQDMLFKNVNVSKIIEQLPGEVVAYVGEEVRLLCKIQYDINTLVTWRKDTHLITQKPNIMFQNYNNRYFALSFLCVSMSDAGNYYVDVHNTVTKYSAVTSCVLKVKERPRARYVLTATILRPLDSVIAYVGSTVVFSCLFDVEEAQFCFAVWEVGPYRVDRSKPNLNVTCNGAEFTLEIEEVKLDMAGVVLCEIHRVVPDQKPFSLCTSSGHLTIVPNDVGKEIAAGLPIHEHKCRYYKYYTARSRIQPPRVTNGGESSQRTNTNQKSSRRKRKFKKRQDTPRHRDLVQMRKRR